MDGPEPQFLSAAAPEAPDAPSHPAVESLPSVGLSRRKVAVVAAGLVAMWLVGVFARQVGEAAQAGSRAAAMRDRNAALEQDVAGLRAELELIQRPAFIASTARGYMIGSPGEMPFTVDRQDSPLPANAPGSVGIKPAVEVRPDSPLDEWLEVLFGQ
jgi:cell division protein FtsB